MGNWIGKIGKFIKDHWVKISGSIIALILITYFIEWLLQKQQNEFDDAKTIERVITEMRISLKEIDNKVNDDKEVIKIRGENINNLTLKLEGNLGEIRGAILRFPFKNDIPVDSNNPNIHESEKRRSKQDYSIWVLNNIQSEINQLKDSASDFENLCSDTVSKSNIIDCHIKRTIWNRHNMIIVLWLDSLQQNIDRSINGLKPKIKICDPKYANSSEVSCDEK